MQLPTLITADNVSQGTSAVNPSFPCFRNSHGLLFGNIINWRMNNTIKWSKQGVCLPGWQWCLVQAPQYTLPGWRELTVTAHQRDVAEQPASSVICADLEAHSTRTKRGETQPSVWLQMANTSQLICSLPECSPLPPGLTWARRVTSAAPGDVPLSQADEALCCRRGLRSQRAQKTPYIAAGQRKVLKQAIKHRRETWKTFPKILINGKILRMERHHKSEL